MEFKTKRRMSFFIIGAYLFLGGCEFAVIFPTVWDYLQSLGTENEQWLGFTVSGYSFTAAIAGIIGGRLSDKLQSQTKMITIVCILIMAIGNFQYTLGYSVWNIFASRCICGLGTAAGASLLAEVCRVTEPEERTPILAICNASRQLGILISPAFQIILSRVNFSIGNYVVTPLSAPGLFMTVLSIIFAILTILMFHNLTDELNDIKSQDLTGDTFVRRKSFVVRGTGPGPEESQDSAISHLQSHTHSRGFRGRILPHLQNPVNSWQDGTEASQNPTTVVERSSILTRRASVSERFFSSVARSDTWTATRRSTIGNTTFSFDNNISLLTSVQRYKDEFLRDTFVVLMSMIFTLFFCQIAIETVIPVMMQSYFGYGEFENSLVYMVGGLAALVVFYLVAFLSKHVRDTTVLLLGWVLMFLAQLWLLIVIPYFSYGSTFHLVCYLIGVLISFIGYPLASAASTGVYSKCLSNETQGLGQGLGRVSSFVGVIFGPTWAGATVRSPYLCLGVPLLLMLVNTIMLVISFKDLRKVEDRQQQREDEETRSLLDGIE